ncbi:hypothetical protein PAE9249_01202 [Paenibacillus sp. CECT 9249]|uniref:SDR family oxidoreductase n=1 Tax=Paenibacillus sp. CECT 9249 TaxID=2845385 RepID=UPI001E4AE204|nr:SDR family oxidoreductase [Paenibacillus sp. CECT 9249]CAH0118709.1 hypothetical protein PAE9249_01202 [Paenibacillus sp. CECT 9249]
MKLLVLGGTVFVGKHIVQAALDKGHEVTMFNRGQTNADLFPGVEKLTGDRDNGLDALRGRSWDAVIDPSAYVPRIAGQSAELLRDAVERYIFVSSISVYRDFAAASIDERYPAGTLDDDSTEQVDGETYGPLKALCERVLEEKLPGRVLTVRPGLIVGPDDRTDRFTYWPWRIRQGGRTLIPGKKDKVIQIIDVRDLAEWIVRMAEQRAAGVYNAVGLGDAPLTMGRLAETAREVAGSAAEFVWIDDSFLLERNVLPFSDFPLWLPESEALHAGFYRISCEKALREGLAFRPLSRTIEDTLHWLERTGRADVPALRVGLPREREQELIEEWLRNRSQ